MMMLLPYSHSYSVQCIDCIVIVCIAYCMKVFLFLVERRSRAHSMPSSSCSIRRDASECPHCSSPMRATTRDQRRHSNSRGSFKGLLYACILIRNVWLWFCIELASDFETWNFFVFRIIYSSSTVCVILLIRLQSLNFLITCILCI